MLSKHNISNILTIKEFKQNFRFPLKKKQVLQVRVFNEIGSIAPVMNDLLKSKDAIPIFHSKEWVINWLKFLGNKYEPFILTLYKEDKLQSFFPLAVRNSFFSRKLEFIGRDDGDYLDFIVDPGSRKASLEAFLSYLRKKKKEWNVCDLKDFPEGSQNYNVLYDLLKREGWKAVLYDTWSCPYLKIEGDWEGFLKNHSRKFRYNIKRGKRLLEDSGKLEFKKVRSWEELEYYLRQVFEVHKKRWKGYFIASKFSTPEGQRFYTEIGKEYLKKGMLRLDLLLLDKKVIAFSYSFQWKDKYLYYTPAYDPAYEKYSPGKILLMYILEDAFKSGLKEFDFSKGELGYKAHWTSGERRNKRIVFASPTLKGKMVFYLYLFYLNLFSRVRKIKSLRVVLSRLTQLNDLIKSRTAYIPPEAVVSPRQIFRVNFSPLTGKRNGENINGSNTLFFKDGRTALLYGLKSCGVPQGAVVLIPAYVCDSVISAVNQAGLKCRFYKVLPNLEPDFADLEMKSGGAEMMLIIHYFGFPQSLDKIMSFCRKKGLLLIEDCAHALYSNWKGHGLGSFGTFGVFSLRKTLPLPDGGMLLLNNGIKCDKPEYYSGNAFLANYSLAEKWTEFRSGFSPRCYLLQIDGFRKGFIKKIMAGRLILIKVFQIYL